MLDSLRKWASGWLAFILISLLILSFAIWGVADVFTGYGRGALVTVGERTISEDEFQRAMQDELANISRQSQQRITMDQARAIGLDRQVLTRLIGGTALEAHAENLGLSLSDQAIAEGLKRDPAFQGSDGKFYKPLLDTIMRQMGVSEAGLIALRRQDELREHITTAMLRSTVVPQAMIDTIHGWREEKRVVSHFTIDADKVVTVPEPTDEQLKAAYEDAKSRYMTPERRDFTALVLSRAALKAQAPISEEQIKAAYEQTKSRYDKPEQREIQQLAFDSLEAAKAAKAEIDAGKDFLEVAKERGAKESDVTLGLRTKADLIDRKIADAAFAIEGGKVSDPVEGRFTTVLLRITKVVDGKESTLDEARESVRDELAGEWAADHIRTLYDAVDDGRAAARPLTDIGAEIGVKTFEIKGADSANTLPDKAIALDVVNAERIIAAAFRAQMGIEQEAIELDDGGFAWVDLKGVTKPEQKPLDEVKAEVTASWRQQQKASELAKVAQGYVDRLLAGEAIEKVAADSGGTVAKTAPFSRAKVPDGLNQSAIAQAFILGAGQAGSSQTNDGRTRIVFRLDEIVPAGAPSEELATQIRNELVQQLRGDQISTYIAALQDRLGVTINERALARLTGADDATR